MPKNADLISLLVHHWNPLQLLAILRITMCHDSHLVSKAAVLLQPHLLSVREIDRTSVRFSNELEARIHGGDVVVVTIGKHNQHYWNIRCKDNK